MAPREAVEARPRSTVEILDDAWRIYFADPVLLLSLAALFTLPALACLLLVLSQPVPPAWWLRPLMPALAALLLPLTGLSAGACQEAYHSWAEGYPVRFGQCMAASLQRGLYHVASQALTLLPAVALVACVAAGLSAAAAVPFAILLVLIWFFSSLFGLSRQPSFAAGQQRFARGFKFAVRATGQHFGRACLVMMMRAIVFVFAVLNMHLFWSFGLWTAENLAGIDVALFDVLCSLGNPVYVLALVGFAWWLLTPFNEAVNYLFFVDARTRYEGLDLWQCVEELFPVERRSMAGAILLALGIGLTTAGGAAAEEPLTAVKAARQEITAMRKEVQAAQPYPGGQRWTGRLKALSDRLEKSSPKPGGFRWFQEAVAGFVQRNQLQAVGLLDEIDTRLALIEDSLTRPRREGNLAEPSKDYIKGLVPPDHSGANKKPVKVEEAKKPKEDPPVEDDKAGPAGGGGAGFQGPGVVGPTGLGAVAYPLLIILVGLGAAVLGAGIAFAIYRWWQNRPKAAPRAQGTLTPRADNYLENPDTQNVRQLWQQADERARAGDYLGAVRTLYLAVLAMLHQAGLIRYERTRTNGEYADQLRPRGSLHRPFLGLTGLFEVKWYGERACQPQDYQACRELAEELRVGSLPTA